MFRQRLDDLSIEEGTTSVPADGRYYVIRAGVTVRSFKTLRGAKTLYDSLRPERGSADASS
ncbi:MAG: hypothetical protein O2822_08320 [Chloroflexi bacterium]|nr:hypothetical protein [Chloroflexota bacterium]